MKINANNIGPFLSFHLCHKENNGDVYANISIVMIVQFQNTLALEP